MSLNRLEPVWRNRRIHLAIADTVFNVSPDDQQWETVDRWLKKHGR